MGLQGALRPGSVERRYAALDENRKTLYYYFRRHLYYTPAEVDAMPWHEKRMYVEMLNIEFSPPDEDDEYAGATVENYDDLTDMGFTVHSV